MWQTQVNLRCCDPAKRRYADSRTDARIGLQQRVDRRRRGRRGLRIVALSGVAGLLTGAFSMALGEYTSVVTIAAT